MKEEIHNEGTVRESSDQLNLDPDNGQKIYSFNDLLSIMARLEGGKKMDALGIGGDRPTKVLNSTF